MVFMCCGDEQGTRTCIEYNRIYQVSGGPVRQIIPRAILLSQLFAKSGLNLIRTFYFPIGQRITNGMIMQNGLCALCGAK